MSVCCVVFVSTLSLPKTTNKIINNGLKLSEDW